MSHRYFSLLTAALMLLPVSSCIKEQTEPNVFTAAPVTLSLTADRQTKDVEITSDFPWEASLKNGSRFSIASAVSTDPSAPGKISVTAPFNSEAREWTDTINVQSGSAVLRIPVTQLGIGSVVAPTQLALQKTKAATFVVNSIEPWSSSIVAAAPGDDVSWLQVTPSSAQAGHSTVTVSAKDENLNVGDRSAIVRLSVCGGTVDVTVSQSQTDALYASGDTVVVSNKGETFSVDLSHNVGYEVTIPGNASSWISRVQTRALDVTDERFEVKENLTEEERSALIFFRSSSLSDTLVVIQPAKDILEVTPDTLTFGFRGGENHADIRANLAYGLAAESVPEWASATLDAATGRLSVTVSENILHENRSAELIFRAEGRDLSDTLTVIQALKPDYPFLDSSTYGVYDMDGSSWTEEAMTSQIGLKGYSDHYSFRLLYPQTSSVVEIASLRYSYQDGQRSAITVNILSGDKVVSKSYKVTVLMQDESTIWMRADGGECFIVKTFEGR